jgi:hypothetical protein
MKGGKRAWLITAVGAAVAAMLAGCSSGGPARVETIPVTGTVTVDGQAVEGVSVTLDRVGDAKNVIPSTAMTDAEGKFAISTYEQGDGAPIGEYTVLFKWPTMNMISMQYEGDRLNGRYSDAKSSKTTVKVETGNPVDLGKIELTTK